MRKGITRHDALTADGETDLWSFPSQQQVCGHDIIVFLAVQRLRDLIFGVAHRHHEL